MPVCCTFPLLLKPVIFAVEKSSACGDGEERSRQPRFSKKRLRAKAQEHHLPQQDDLTPGSVSQRRRRVSRYCGVSAPGRLAGAEVRLQDVHQVRVPQLLELVAQPYHRLAHL